MRKEQQSFLFVTILFKSAFLETFQTLSEFLLQELLQDPLCFKYRQTSNHKILNITIELKWHKLIYESFTMKNKKLS